MKADQAPVDRVGLVYRGFVAGVVVTLIAAFLSGTWPTLPDDYPKLPLFRTDLGPACAYQAGVSIDVIDKTTMGLWPDEPCP